MTIVQPIFPPPDYLKDQVYNNKHCDDRDRKNMSETFPYLRLEKFILIYSDLGMLKKYGGLYVLSAQSDNKAKGVGKKTRLFKFGKDLNMPARLTNYVHMHGHFHTGKGNANGVKIYMLIRASRKSDYINKQYVNSSINTLEKNTLTHLRQNHEISKHELHYQGRGVERFIISIELIKKVIHNIVAKMNQNVADQNKKAKGVQINLIVKEIDKYKDKEYNSIKKGFMYTLVEPKGQWQNVKKGTKWKITAIKGDKITLTKMKNMKSMTKIQRVTDLASMAIFQAI